MKINYSEQKIISQASNEILFINMVICIKLNYK